jgi:hypothetical protein
MSDKDTAYAASYIGLPWKKLEMEQQAHARQMMRAGLLKIEGTGPGRRVVHH